MQRAAPPHLGCDRALPPRGKVASRVPFPHIAQCVGQVEILPWPTISLSDTVSGHMQCQSWETVAHPASPFASQSAAHQSAA
jgi:hypothetical protein